MQNFKTLVYTKIIVWWIKTVFWPHHLKTHGNVYALLILDNFSAHKYLDDSDVARKFGLTDKLCIIFLPPYLTSLIQPADMGIIAVLKVGHKISMVRKLLAVYEDQTFTENDTAQKRQKIGCKSI